MHFEYPQGSKVESAEIKKMRERAENVSDAGNIHEGAVYDLAKKEDEFRDELKAEGLKGESVGRLADKFSDEVLEKIEAQKESGELKEESLVDPLTGLYNRRAIQRDLSLMVSLGIREGKSNSFVMVDADHFKRINDNFGHLAGDKVLQDLAGLIKKNIRKSDRAFRYGGEEFLIFFPATSSEIAFKLMEELRKKIEAYPIEIKIGEESKEIKITASFGISDTSQIKNTASVEGVIEEAIKNSDAAMYDVKNSGKNRVKIFESQKI